MKTKSFELGGRPYTTPCCIVAWLMSGSSLPLCASTNGASLTSLTSDSWEEDF